LLVQSGDDSGIETSQVDWEPDNFLEFVSDILNALADQSMHLQELRRDQDGDDVLVF